MPSCLAMAISVQMLERNVVRFVKQRSRLAQLGMPTKKGLLFYGPPGTGKTHTIHYLIGRLVGHTTFLVTAEQVGALSDYMTLARLMQPSIVIIEDADLIGRERDGIAVGRLSAGRRRRDVLNALAKNQQDCHNSNQLGWQ